MEMMCPKGAMSRMASVGEGSDKGCQCVPDFLISLVMPSAAGRSLDRASGKVNIKIGKKTCKCSYGIVEANCKKSKFTCDKKCSGKATGVEVEDGMYVMDLIIREGKGQGLEMEEKVQEPQDVLVYQREWEEQDLHLLLGAVQDLGQPHQQGVDQDLGLHPLLAVDQDQNLAVDQDQDQQVIHRHGSEVMNLMGMCMKGLGWRLVMVGLVPV